MPLSQINPKSWNLPACCLLGIFLLLPTSDLASAEPTLGPKRGTLVIVGGGDRGYAVFRQFIDLAGGQNAKIVIVPTASSSKPGYPYQESRAALYARNDLKMPHVTVVHTHDRVEAETEAFVRPIREADAVWFTGGRQWRIADAYLGTLTEKEFRKVLDRGGVIGGSSAGASIQGSFLVRGDTKGSQILIGNHQQGLGFIQNSAIDQHVIPRKRQNGLIAVLEDPKGRMDPKIDRQALLGIGIDEATGIVVRKNVFEVIGKDDGVVLVYDPGTWTEGMVAEDRYQTLSHGARYDLEARKVLAPGTPSRPATTTGH